MTLTKLRRCNNCKLNRVTTGYLWGKTLADVCIRCDRDAYTKQPLVVYEGVRGWNIYPPGTTAEDIANRKPFLVGGPWEESRTIPYSAYQEATAILARG